MQRVGALPDRARNPAIDKFGSGKHGFKPGNPLTSEPATTPGSEWFDAVQEEIAGVIEGFGVALDPTRRDQLYQTIKAQFKGLAQTNNPTFTGGMTLVDKNAKPVMSFDADGKLTLSWRPSWGGATPWDSSNFDPNLVLLKSGGTLSGSIRVLGDWAYYSADAKASGQSMGYFMAMMGRNRWYIAADNAESAVDGVGSNLIFYRYHNDGSLWDVPLYISRQSGQAVFGYRPQWGGFTPWDSGNLNPADFARTGSVIADIRLGAEVSTGIGPGARAPAGNVLTGINADFTLSGAWISREHYSRPLQKLVGGVWYTVATA